MPDRRRLFFALWPDAELRRRIATQADALATHHHVQGRRIPAERLHLTLLFLGEVLAADEGRVREAADRVSVAPFELELDRAGSFFRSRVMWIGAHQAPETLNALWRALRDRLGDLALEHNRIALRPHVTCFRDIDKPFPPTALEPLRWHIRDFVLVHSTLGAEPRYHVVSHWPLQTARA